MKQFQSNDQETISNILNTIDCIRIEKGLTMNRLALDAEISENTIKYIFVTIQDPRSQALPTGPRLTGESQ